MLLTPLNYESAQKYIVILNKLDENVYAKGNFFILMIKCLLINTNFLKFLPKYDKKILSLKEKIKRESIEMINDYLMNLTLNDEE